MLDKAFYFKIGDKEIQIAVPKDGFSRVFIILWTCLLISDIISSNMFGIFISMVFLSLFLVRIR